MSVPAHGVHVPNATGAVGPGRPGLVSSGMSPERPRELVLTLSCPDRVGIVHAVSGFLAERGANIVESQQFGDRHAGAFFMRVRFEGRGPAARPERLAGELAGVAGDLGMAFEVHDTARRPPALVLVSRLGHCLNDLLYRHRTGALRAEIALVVSNHPDFEPLVTSYGIPFRHLPVTPDTKPAQEAALVGLIEEHGIELVVLARYMQVLSAGLSQRLAGRAINIHHSFLPSFSGARPYHQAHARGVKLIGATAHYVTAELDQGPIIEQEVVRVDHTLDADQLAAVGRDVESLVLARAVTWHAEHRVVVNGNKTIVFR